MLSVSSLFVLTKSQEQFSWNYTARGKSMNFECDPKYSIYLRVYLHYSQFYTVPFILVFYQSEQRKIHYFGIIAYNSKLSSTFEVFANNN